MADVQADSGEKHSSSETEDEESVSAVVVVAEEDENEESQNKTPTRKEPTKKSPAKPPSSPKISYIQLVQDAIVAMKDRTGSSQVAIQKFILANHPELPPGKLKNRLLLTLKIGVANKRLLKVKASYKIHPDAKKKKKKKKPPQKKIPEKKKLTKEQIAAQKEKERQAVKEKERLERIRKRKFPMDDLELIVEDKELKVSISLPTRPSLPLVMPEFAAACKSDTVGSGIMDDAFHVYHFFRGDVGWGRFPMNKDVVAPFALQQWLECVQYVLRGDAKKARMLPPLMTHLFVVALQRLVPKQLQVGLTPASWSEILMLYMDAMERYYTTEASLDSSALPGLGIDGEYLMGVTDEPKDESMLDPPTQRQSNFYLQGSLEKVLSKLFGVDPWMLSAEELVILLKTLVDDLMATQPECSEVLDTRLQESYELLKRKREADAHFRKLQNLRKREQNEEKEKEDNSEMATRSNTRLPSISEAQFETARRSQQKVNEAYEKACLTDRVRTEMIGEDCNHHSVYHFWNDPERILIAQRGKALPSQTSFAVPGSVDIYRTIWHSIDKRSMLEKYIESLDVRGKREAVLSEALQPAVKTVEDDIKTMNDKKALLKDKRELQRRLENAKLKCEVGRKSGRLAAQSEQEFFTLQTEIENLAKLISGDVEPEKPGLEVSTGLEMLRDFDQQDGQNQHRRATRRDIQKKQEEEKEETFARLQCSKLWSTGNIDGTGIVGSIVWELLELEERVERLAGWEKGDRKAWITSLETVAHSWHTTSQPHVEETVTSFSPVTTSDNGSDKKKHRRLSGESSPGPTSFQTVHMIKHPLLELEQRVFEITGLAMAARDADDADDNMSASHEDENKEEQLQLAWKKLVHRLNRLPAKAHSKIRHLVVDAIAAARKAQQATVVAQLREALLQFHPDAAGACKSAALEILEQHGGYEDDDDDDDDVDEMEDPDDAGKDVIQKEQSEAGLSTVLSFEAVILNSSLDGQEDASRSDWIGTVKKTKTISKLGALVAAFCSKASTKLDKLESEKESLTAALEGWEKSQSLRKKTNKKQESAEPSEVWTNVTFTNDFCLAKVEEYPWWPAKKCIVKDAQLAKTLVDLERTVISLVGESGGLRVVKKDGLLPFSETLPEEDLTVHSKEIRTQLDDCMTMARRIIRGKQKKSRKSSKGKQATAYVSEEDKEEKKLAT